MDTTPPPPPGTKDDFTLTIDNEIRVELEIMTTIHRSMMALDEEGRKRVLTYFIHKYGSEMKHLLVFSPNKTDATSYYRCAGPLLSLERRSNDLKVRFADTANWVDMRWADAVMIQRPMLDSHVQVMNLAKVNRKPVIVDYDDDLYAVPFSNPTHSIYSKAKAQNNVTTLVANADVVTVSTPALARKFAEIIATLAKSDNPEPGWKLTNKIVLLPNAYDEEILGALDAPIVRQRNLICWRGSSTHNADLWSHCEAFCNAFAKHLHWTLNMIGSPFFGFIQAVENIPGVKPTSVVVTETLDPMNYFELLALVAPKIMIAPLEDNVFNRAKSNIVWLEGLHAGAVTLAPDWEEWRRPGVFTYKDPEDFGRRLEVLMSGAINTPEMVREGREFVAEHLTLTKVNGVRESTIRELMGINTRERSA